MTGILGARLGRIAALIYCGIFMDRHWWYCSIFCFGLAFFCFGLASVLEEFAEVGEPKR